MLGLSIQYSYKAININVMKYSSTFLSKYTRIPFLISGTWSTQMNLKTDANIFSHCIICSGVTWAAITSFAFWLLQLLWLKNTKMSWFRLRMLGIILLTHLIVRFTAARWSICEICLIVEIKTEYWFIYCIQEKKNHTL